VNENDWGERPVETGRINACFEGSPKQDRLRGANAKRALERNLLWLDPGGRTAKATKIVLRHLQVDWDKGSAGNIRAKGGLTLSKRPKT